MSTRLFNLKIVCEPIRNARSFVQLYGGEFLFRRRELLKFVPKAI